MTLKKRTEKKSIYAENVADVVQRSVFTMSKRKRIFENLKVHTQTGQLSQ